MGEFFLAEDIFNNDAKSINALNCNRDQFKKAQLVFTLARAEPRFPREHEPFNIHFNFENTGDADAEEFAIRMITKYLDDKSLGVDLEDQVVSLLKSGEEEEITLTFEYGMPAGNYIIVAYLDYFNQIHEDEDMMHRHKSFDLTVG